MMTSIQLAQRLSQATWGVDLARLNMTNAEQLRDAINAGLDEFGTLLPSHRRRRSAEFLLEAPTPVTLTVTEASTTVAITSSFPLSPILATSADVAGRGVVIPGETHLHRLLSSTQLAAAWLGSTGSKAATLYSDGVMLGARLDQVAGGVTLRRADGGGLPSPKFLQGGDRQNEVSLGIPDQWWLDEIGGADAMESGLVLRVWPQPSQRLRLTIPLLQFVAPVTLSDLHVTSRTIPVLEIEHQHVLSLISEHLLPANKDLDEKRIRAAAEAARVALKARSSPSSSGQPNTVGTPPGF